MSTQDLFDDDWPHTHGTAEGFDAGCRGGACPADIEFGMSCKRAKTLSRGDFRYNRLVAAGRTPAEIAAELDGREPTSAAQPLAERSNDPEPQEGAQQPAAEEEAPAEGTPAAEGEEMGHPTTPEETTMPTPNDAARASKPLTAVAPRIAASEVNDKTIRAWAQHHGIDVNPRGKVRTDVADQFRAAHDIYADTIPDEPTTEPEPAVETPDTAHRSDLLDETRKRIDEPIILSEEAAERIEAAIDEEIAAAADATAAEVLDDADLPSIALGHGAWMDDEERAWRKAIADQIRRNCTPSSEAYAKGGDYLVYGVADWIEDPPAWSRFETPAPSGAVTAGAGPVVDIPGPHPEWAHVAISEDVERARNIAVMLEQEVARLQADVARTTTDRDTALAALSTALVKWDVERSRHLAIREAHEEILERDYVDVLRLEAELRTAKAQNMALQAKVDRLQGERPWWKRGRR